MDKQEGGIARVFQISMVCQEDYMGAHCSQKQGEWVSDDYGQIQ